MRILIVGCGPSGERWREIECNRLIACNSAIVDTADVADYFMVMENLGRHPEMGREYPWLWTDTKATKLLTTGILNRINRPVLGNIRSMARNPGVTDWTAPTNSLCIGPRMYNNARIGTVCLQAIHFACQLNPAEIHLIGFPFQFTSGIQHWTEATGPYTPDGPGHMKRELFVTVNGIPTYWPFVLSAAYIATRDFPVPLINHSGGLLDLPRIGEAMRHVHDEPRSLEL